MYWPISFLIFCSAGRISSCRTLSFSSILICFFVSVRSAALHPVRLGGMPVDDILVVVVVVHPTPFMPRDSRGRVVKFMPRDSRVENQGLIFGAKPHLEERSAAEAEGLEARVAKAEPLARLVAAGRGFRFREGFAGRG